MHRGPLREGEWVRLVDSKGRRHNFSLEPGKRFFSNKGHLDHDELIGREEGFTVTSSGGGEYLVFRPLLSEYVHLDAARRGGGLPEGRRADHRDGRHLPGRPRRRGGRRLRGADLQPAARGRARAAGSRRTSGARSSPTWPAATSRQFFGAAEPPGLVARARRPRRAAAGLRSSAATGSSSTCWPRGSASTPSRGAAARRDPVCVRRDHHPAVASSSRRCGCTVASPSRPPGSRWSATGTSRGWPCGPTTRMIGHTAFLVTASPDGAGGDAPAEAAPAGPGRLRPRLHGSPATGVPGRAGRGVTASIS